MTSPLYGLLGLDALPLCGFSAYCKCVLVFWAIWQSLHDHDLAKGRSCQAGIHLAGWRDKIHPGNFTSKITLSMAFNNNNCASLIYP